MRTLRAFFLRLAGLFHKDHRDRELSDEIESHLQLPLPRFRTTLLSSYALFATLLALFGIYSVATYLLSQRQQEFGIRMALGAQRFQLVGFALLHCSIWPILCGIVIGLLGSIGVVRLVSAFLYGVKPFDPTTYAIVIFSLIFLTALAAYLPARRAARVDPMRALREERS